MHTRPEAMSFRLSLLSLFRRKNLEADMAEEMQVAIKKAGDPGAATLLERTERDGLRTYRCVVEFTNARSSATISPRTTNWRASDRNSSSCRRKPQQSWIE
jgi:hypothetical protein